MDSGWCPDCNLSLACNMRERIWQSQLSDLELQSRVGHLIFTQAMYGNILFNHRICVPNDSKFRRAILEEAHKSGFTIHHGSSKMYQDLKKNY